MSTVIFVMFLVLAVLSVLGVRTPTAVRHIPRSPDVIAACLANEDRDRVDVSPLANGGRRVDILNGKQSPIATFLIYPEQRGSRVEFSRELLALVWMNWKTCVQPNTAA